VSLAQKFRVERVDPGAQSRHPDCEHFVLDLRHDKVARVAARVYASVVALSDPELAKNLRAWVLEIERDQGE
jgi:hypothetical protein